MEQRNFEFELGSTVAIEASGERGKVIGHAEYISGEHAFLLRYKAADGRAVENWWNASALVPVAG